MAEPTAAAELEQLLAEERQLVLAGRLAEVAELADRKARLASRLDGATERVLQPLRAAARRNGELMAAAATGVRSVVQLLRSRAPGGVTFTTYDGRGRAAALDTGPGGPVRRV